MFFYMSVMKMIPTSQRMGFPFLLYQMKDFISPKLENIPKKQSHWGMLKKFSLEQLTQFFGISYVLIETCGIQLQIATYCPP